MRCANRNKKAAASTLCAVVLLNLTPEPAAAHAVAIGQSKIQQQREVVRYEIAGSYDELAKRVAIEAPDSPSSQLAATTDSERNEELRASTEDLEPYLASHIRILVDGNKCDSRLRSVDVMRYRGELFAVMSLIYRCPESASNAYEVHYDLFFDDLSNEENVSQANVADYELGGKTGRFLFEPDNERLSLFEPATLPSTQESKSATSSTWRFLVLGFEHILGGIDHALFILVLLLGGRSFTRVIKVATAFTLAHSVTLALAAMGLVNVPASIVEPLIALSIAYVAIENIVRGEWQYRPLVVFGFGLLHGLGFAGALSVSGGVDWRLISSLFAFNTGIELGQALIIISVWPLLLLVRRLQWPQVAQTGASGLIAGVGVLWLFSRLPLN